MTTFNKFEDFDFSLLDTEFYKFDRAKFLANSPLHERLSSGEIKYKYISSTEDLIKVGTKYLTKFSNGIFKFVTNENISNVIFTFKTNSSYCELLSNKVVIDFNILRNDNLPYQIRIDSLMGIIFHEFLHKRITIKDIATYLEIPINEYYHNDNKHLLEMFLGEFVASNRQRLIWNILEDFRIEKQGVKLFPGFGFFLDEARKYSFYHLKNRDNKANKSFGLFAIDYLLIKILMPELIDLTVSEGELHHGEEYKNFVDEINKCILKHHSNIYGDTFEQIKKGVELLDKIFDKFGVKESEMAFLPSFSKGNPFVFNPSDNEKPNYETSNAKIEELEILLSELVSEVNKNSEAQNNANQKTNITNAIVEEVQKTEHARNIKTVKIYKAEKEQVEKEILNQATKFSQSICTNLGFLSARLNKNNNDYGLTEGEIDETELYSIAFSKNIFYNENKIKGYELDIGILLDESGSMGWQINDAKIACLALMLSLKNDKHINLYVYGHTADYRHTEEGERDPVVLFKYYNTKENFTDIKTIFSARSRSNNADGFAIEKICDIMSRSKNKNKVLLVISDGQPAASCYSYQQGVTHTHEVVKKYEAKGYHVIQICMANIENSASMFTNFIPYENDKKFVDKLKGVLNKILIKFHNQV